MQALDSRKVMGWTVGCATCGGAADIRSPHVVVDGSAVKVYCSDDCLDGIVEIAEVSAEELPPPRRRRHAIAAGLLGLALATDVRLPEPTGPLLVIRAPEVPAPPPVAAPEPPPVPTIEEEWVAEILRDVWIHPLRGPNRRMPMRHGRVFGAERPGERPPECKNGHCGVDIGGEIWGEPVIAVHDGVVDRVQRGPNEDRGGLYVRLSHRDGTVFTQYFHLAAIPKWITVGKKVAAGEVIGLLGDTGVKESGPHLHFTISVKPAPKVPETFIDPEPLIALWPLKMPVDTRSEARPLPVLSINSAPGTVIGAAGGRRKGKARRAVVEDVADAPGASGDGAAPPVESSMMP